MVAIRSACREKYACGMISPPKVMTTVENKNPGTAIQKLLAQMRTTKPGPTGYQAIPTFPVVFGHFLLLLETLHLIS